MSIFLLIIVLIVLLAMWIGWWTLQQEEREELFNLDRRRIFVSGSQCIYFVHGPPCTITGKQAT